MKLFKKDAVSAVRELIAKVESAIAKTQLKLAATEAEVEKHRAARREHLRTNPGEEVPASTRHGLDVAEGQVTACKEILAEHETHLVELREALAAAEDQAGREIAAKVDEDLASFVDSRIALEVEKGAAIIAGAARAYFAAVQPSLELVESQPYSRPTNHPRKYAQHFSPAELLAAIVAEALANAAPELFGDDGRGRSGTSISRMFDLDHSVPTMDPGGQPPPPARNAAKLLLSDRLRARAAATRAGGVVPVTAVPEPVFEPAREPHREIQVFATRAFSYIDGMERPTACGGRWVHPVPEPVADAAVRAGVALRTDHPAGRDAFREEQERRKTNRGGAERSFTALADCVDLGDPCGFMRPSRLDAAE